MAASPIMDASPVSMPGTAARARGALADHYDRETASRLELARFAHDRGLKSTFQHLVQMAGQSRKYAQTARQMQGLHDVMAAHIAAGSAASSPGPQAPPVQAPPAATVPHYAMGTGAMPPPPGPPDPSSDPNAGGLPQGWQPSKFTLSGPVPGAPGPAGPQGPAPPPPQVPGPPHYACGTGMPGYADGGVHPGGPAVVGEQGPEAATLPNGSQAMVGQGGPQEVSMPAGTTVAPNILTIIRMLLDVYQSQQDQGGASDVQELEATRVPHYAFGTGGSRPGLVQPPSAFGYHPPVAPRPIGPNPEGFIGNNGQFNGNQGLQGIQEENALAGNYGPTGSPVIAEMAKQNILGGMGARQDQAAKTADIYAAGDPSFRAYARLKAGTDTASEAARAYSAAQLAQAESGQQFGRNVYLNQLSAITRKDPKTGNPLAAAGGQLLGAGIGALVGGPAGATAGAGVGGKALSGTGDPGSGPEPPPQYAAARPDPNALSWGNA